MDPTESSLDDLDNDVFGPLVAIPPESLVLLAKNLRSKIFKISTSAGSLIARIGGSYNLVHVVQLDDFKLVIRVPATGWGSGMTTAAAHALESQVATLRLIASKTTIPVPEIYAIDTTKDNEIGAPYVCMSFISGETVSKAWFDDDNTGQFPLEDRRLKILTSVSQYLAQFSQLRFEKIGSVHGDVDSSFTIGPCYHWHQNDNSSLSIVESGPFDTLAAYLQEHQVATDTGSVWGIAEAKLIDNIVPHLPAQSPNEGFVLSIPDFDSQNIMVDKEGNVTGIIDWDLAQTTPRCVGYCRYPGWITRDWDPLMYGWPKIKESENSPEELERYREFYNQAIGAALEWKGDWGYTKKSQIREAVWIAALNTPNRLEICRQMVQVAMGVGVDAMDVLYDIGSDELEEEAWCDLKKKLAQLIS